MDELFKKLEKYNYWDKKTVRSGFLRELYVGKIKDYLGNNLVKVLIGQRRVGKSYILRQMIQLFLKQGVPCKNIFYLNKELIDFDEVKKYSDLIKLIEHYKKTLKPKGKIYVLLDEIQEIEGWEKVVNSLAQDYKEEYELFITGSNSRLLSGELATYLSGRYISFEILPFLFGEYTDYLDIDNDNRGYMNYLKTGGLPELFHLLEEESKRHYISSLKDTILLKDIIQRYRIKDASLLESVHNFSSDNIGNLFSINSLVNYLNSHNVKTNHETVSNYMRYIVQTFLIHEVKRFDIKGKNLLSGSRKYYLNDLSFRNYLFSGFDYGLGKHLENALYIYYRQQGYKIYVGTIDSYEIDFVLEKDGERIYLQAAYLLSSKKVIDREFESLKKIKDTHQKIVVSLDDVSFGNKDGIRHIRPWEI